METYKNTCLWCKIDFQTVEPNAQFCCPMHMKRYNTEKKKFERELQKRFQALPSVKLIEEAPAIIPKAEKKQPPKKIVHEIAKYLGYNKPEEPPIYMAIKISMQPDCPYKSYGTVIRAWHEENEM